jgi:hypothetical protein
MQCGTRSFVLRERTSCEEQDEVWCRASTASVIMIDLLIGSRNGGWPLSSWHEDGQGFQETADRQPSLILLAADDVRAR